MIVELFALCFCFSRYGDLRDLHVLTHPFPTRRSSDLDLEDVRRAGGTVDHQRQDVEGAALAEPPEPLDGAGEVDLRRVTDHGSVDRSVDRKSTRLNSSH